MTMPAGPVLVVAAHPDDEVLGLGGTLARHVAAGDEVHALVLCEAMSLRYPDATDDFLSREGRASAEVLGLSSWTLVGLPDQGLDKLSLVDVAAPIERAVQELKPAVLYVPWRGDINRDHRLAQDAALVGARCKVRSIRQIFAYETPSETEWGVPYNFSPNHFVDISDYLDTKIEAMRCYVSQTPDPPHPRSLEHLRLRAHYWGQCMMMPAAEPFSLLRSYWR
ncbi:MAG: PIG-L family deacetylase [Acidobacteria bacterium]|nr:PIG-L family deacetylase [Acidobacteriota bacterium]